MIYIISYLINLFNSLIKCSTTQCNEVLRFPAVSFMGGMMPQEQKEKAVVDSLYFRLLQYFS